MNDGDTISGGEVIAKVPRETTKTKDITGGLPRVASSSRPASRGHAIVAEIDGVVLRQGHQGQAQGDDHPRGERRAAADLAKEYLNSKGKHIWVHSGERVRAGEPMMDGAANRHDILKVLGEKELARYLVDEVQEVTGCRA